MFKLSFKTKSGIKILILINELLSIERAVVILSFDDLINPTKLSLYFKF